MPASAYFGKHGVLAGLLPGFYYNPGQERMAALVEQALRDREYLIVEAGTGTGKTFAYLIPAIESGRRVVVSTATKALQEQLIGKDIPFLRETVGLRFEAVQMKGRGNYLCPRRLAEFLRQPTFEVREEAEYLDAVVRWAERTQTGDRAEIAGLPEALRFWDDICSHADYCLGHRCGRQRDCFVAKLRARAAADLVIVNHHLFFADLAVRGRADAEVIPGYEAVVFDEAHQIEAIATEFFGFTVSNYRFDELVRDARRVLGEKRGKVDAADQRLLERFRKIADQLLLPLWRRCRDDRRLRLRAEDRDAETLRNLRRLGTFAEAVAVRVERRARQDSSEEAAAIARRARDLARETETIFALDDRALVYWCERRGKGIFLSASPIDVSNVLAERLYESVGTVVFTSATLATGDDFSYFKRRVGLPREAIEARIPSHFDFRRQGLLYLPRDLPEPGNPEFTAALAREVLRVIRASRGRAMVLFTSYANMNEVHERVQGQVPYECLLQGSRPKSVLLTEFREKVSSVLFATTSFWQGVDVRGEALSCLVIDKIPFDVPSDPVVEARIEQINRDGGNAFREFQLPEAIIALKQGMGRLIRDRTDRGVVVICDVRLVTKHYGKTILASLPTFPVTRDFGDVASFFADPGPL